MTVSVGVTVGVGVGEGNLQPAAAAIATITTADRHNGRATRQEDDKSVKIVALLPVPRMCDVGTASCSIETKLMRHGGL